MPVEFDKTIQGPASVFTQPEDVLRDESLSREQKVEILRRWEYNVSEEAVALEEGMPGDETDLLRRILIALGAVAGSIDMDLTAPIKQHGLSRRSVGLQNEK
ncbi:hypothetical protein GCM10007920_38540 [Ciceribacter naphthalenivorans]|uniref:Uncharacterized protein n=2 Tax=Alphaproteobacteria TaxID=28211 RepID=A0A512HPW6_9HYPH|nr:hypothetical protein RNA01_44270 [Ciceribacter naphthalenivorans]GLR24060.1 hypothetical protein GCM10007920_38540 [Ciceribacter naphthalenivorans]GLT06916.1 hypothetical protein GCM10007926_38540 [Sphingomonas psychrolutea]